MRSSVFYFPLFCNCGYVVALDHFENLDSCGEAKINHPFKHVCFWIKNTLHPSSETPAVKKTQRHISIDSSSKILSVKLQAHCDRKSVMLLACQSVSVSTIKYDRQAKSSTLQDQFNPQYIIGGWTLTSLNVISGTYHKFVGRSNRSITIIACMADYLVTMHHDHAVCKLSLKWKITHTHTHTRDSMHYGYQSSKC